MGRRYRLCSLETGGWIKKDWRHGAATRRGEKKRRRATRVRALISYNFLLVRLSNPTGHHIRTADQLSNFGCQSSICVVRVRDRDNQNIIITTNEKLRFVTAAQRAATAKSSTALSQQRRDALVEDTRAVRNDDEHPECGLINTTQRPLFGQYNKEVN